MNLRCLIVSLRLAGSPGLPTSVSVASSQLPVLVGRRNPGLGSVSFLLQKLPNSPSSILGRNLPLDFSIPTRPIDRTTLVGKDRNTVMENARTDGQRKLSKAQRRGIASTAAKARWAKTCAAKEVGQGHNKMGTRHKGGTGIP
jgi:hypothetical protein